jgi:hypothetical protein
VNTYDLVEVADLGLVYTTTVGMEMAMCGVPVIVSGQTHYRGRGFTYDPDSWVSYFKLLGPDPGQASAFPAEARRRSRAPGNMPTASSLNIRGPSPGTWCACGKITRPARLSMVCGPEGQEQYGETFRYLVGEPIDWQSILEAESQGTNDRNRVKQSVRQFYDRVGWQVERRALSECAL